MIFFSKTPCGCFLIALWYPETTAKNAGRYAKKNPITILQKQFKDRCSQTYFQFFGITFSFAVSLVRSLLIFEICCRRHIEVSMGPLHDPVTWYKIIYTGEQVAQWDFQNNATRTSSPGPAFVLKVPLRNLLTSIYNFVPCDRIVQRAH